MSNSGTPYQQGQRDASQGKGQKNPSSHSSDTARKSYQAGHKSGGK